MRLEKLVGERFKERPADCATESHALMVRGGYIKPVSQGIFSFFAPMKRIAKKIEQIIREEMDAIDGQEVLFPVVLPAALWQSSGRWDSVGPELARFSDRGGAQMLLGMTHEEPCVELARDFGKSYARYPFMMYQIQTKFRDEARPRAGIIRTKEFTMKDAYSFHTSRADLEEYYGRAMGAYSRIFRRAGLGKDVVIVKSDTGMMGGDAAHEFMLLTPVGEDSIALCAGCGAAANLEAAPCSAKNPPSEPRPLEKVATPGAATIEAVCATLGLPAESSCKAVVYQLARSGGYVALFIRGDMEANETKLARHLGEEIRPAAISACSGLVPGYLGPGARGARQLFDRSLSGLAAMCCGANDEGFHYTGFNIPRDFGETEYFDFAKARDGDECPACGEPSLEVRRGIEIGNIFQLGEKYTKAMDMRYTDEDGAQRHPVMGCYGIGVGRLAAAVCEARRDERGPIWPMSIAPWQVHLCCVRADDAETRAAADSLYQQLRNAGAEVLYDDRPVSAGVMFSDADLLGAPIRVVASPRNMKDGACEISARNGSFKESAKLAGAAGRVMEAIRRAQEAAESGSGTGAAD